MTARTLAAVLALAAVVLAVAAVLPAGGPRAGFGLAVMFAAVAYLAAGLIPPRRRPAHLTVIVGVRAGPVARCWTWPAPAPPAL